MHEFAAGWWHSARHRPSPNFDQRPPAARVDLLVIHAISLPPQEFGGSYIESLFMNQLQPLDHPSFAVLAGLRVSAHFLIERGGGVIQFVPVTARAWHAGVSSFGGISACNNRAIGIELEGADTCAFAPVQYEVLTNLCVALCGEYPQISLAHVIGHADIAPGRKTDPGPCFDWIMFRAQIARRLVTGSNAACTDAC